MRDSLAQSKVGIVTEPVGRTRVEVDIEVPQIPELNPGPHLRTGLIIYVDIGLRPAQLRLDSRIKMRPLATVIPVPAAIDEESRRDCLNETVVETEAVTPPGEQVPLIVPRIVPGLGLVGRGQLIVVNFAIPRTARLRMIIKGVWQAEESYSQT